MSLLVITAVLTASVAGAQEYIDDPDEVEAHARLPFDGGSGAVEEAPGVGDDASVTPSLAAARPLLKWGLHPAASDALRKVGISAGRITQTIGGARDSVGTHLEDGEVNGRPYSAATDISTRGWSARKIRNILEKLARQGFAAWYRKPGSDHWPSNAAPHIHAVYVGCKMKPILRRQVHSWLKGRNGLRSNAPYRFFRPSAAGKRRVQALFRAHGGGAH
jgi:hypothetical protein